MTLASSASGTAVVRYVATVDEFRAARRGRRAAGTPLVNAGYTYDTEIIERLPRIEPGPDRAPAGPEGAGRPARRLTPAQEQARPCSWTRPATCCPNWAASR